MKKREVLIPQNAFRILLEHRLEQSIANKKELSQITFGTTLLRRS